MKTTREIRGRPPTPKVASQSAYDLIVIGGGVYGITLTLEAARRGLRTLLLERADFGSQTSWNSLRILHGGLRYLQNLDLRRFSESVGERSWMLRNFPDLVRPLGCLMPLYGSGLRRPSILRLAMAANEWLSRNRNDELDPDNSIPEGKVVSKEETLRHFPSADEQGLLGGALWFDAYVEAPQILLTEMLRWASACGAVSLNYVKAEDLLVEGGNVRGVLAVDRVDDEVLTFSAPLVVNTSGPWCREVAERLDREVEPLHHLSIGFNLLLDIPALSSLAVAVAPNQPGARTYFLLPSEEGVLAGTSHQSWTGPPVHGGVKRSWVVEFLQDLCKAMPNLRLDEDQVLRIDWGFLPTDTPGSPVQSRSAVICHHRDEGGPEGLFSVSGVKFTTAHLVALRVLRTLHRYQGSELPEPAPGTRPTQQKPIGPSEIVSRLESDSQNTKSLIRRMIEEESVVHLDDLLLRRTKWGCSPQTSSKIARQVATVLDWSDERLSHEIARFDHIVKSWRETL